MKLAIPAQEPSLAVPVSLRFSRCPFFLLVETDSGQTEFLPNPALGLLADAGIRAARFLIEQGVQGVIAVMIGQHARQVLQEAAITIYEPELPTGQQILKNFRSGWLHVRTSSLDLNHD